MRKVLGRLIHKITTRVLCLNWGIYLSLKSSVSVDAEVAVKLGSGAEDGREDLSKCEHQRVINFKRNKVAAHGVHEKVVRGLVGIDDRCERSGEGVKELSDQVAHCDAPSQLLRHARTGMHALRAWGESVGTERPSIETKFPSPSLAPRATGACSTGGEWESGVDSRAGRFRGDVHILITSVTVFIAV